MCSHFGYKLLIPQRAVNLPKLFQAPRTIVTFSLAGCSDFSNFYIAAQVGNGRVAPVVSCGNELLTFILAARHVQKDIDFYFVRTGEAHLLTYILMSPTERRARIFTNLYFVAVSQDY